MRSINFWFWNITAYTTRPHIAIKNYFIGLSEADLWANSEDLNTILENCLRFVIIDKALLACLLVIELLDLRQVCGTFEDRRKHPSKSIPENSTAEENLPQSISSPNKSQDEKSNVKGNGKSPAANGSKKIVSNGQDNGLSTPRGSLSPRREKLKHLKHTKTELEREISDMHEDTTTLETELFSTMEEKTKVEEELYGMKHHVTKLRSELFHLKLEKSNLENDVKKSKSPENLQQSTDLDGSKPSFESPKEPQRGYPELSDVMEASHESNDSENSSQMSDGNETREAFLKTCMENISKIYTLMPNPDEEIASEDELSDDQEPTLSDANIDDSDEEIIITKLARSLRSPCTSPAKEKTFEASSPNKGGKRQTAVGMGNDVPEDLGGKSKEALVKQIHELKRKLHKAEQELAEARETNEDLEEELDHKKGQLAEAQETITSLENQIVEEKETCEQVRQQYFNVKTQNEILEGKIKALRSEIERVLRDCNGTNAAGKTTESSRRDNPPPSPTKTRAKSPVRSPAKSKVPKIDLRTPPPKQLTSNEMEFIALIEENAEMKVKLGKATQEKARLEKSQKFVEEKSSKMKAALQTSEDACSRFKQEMAELTKQKVRLTGEVTDLRNNNSNMAEELQKHREKSTRLEKDIEAIAYMSTRLEKNNKMLEMEISKMESELSTWKSKEEIMSQEFQRLDQENQLIRMERETALLELGTIKKEKSQLLEQRFSIDEEKSRKEKELKDSEERFHELESEVSEQKRLNSNLQKELAGMAEYQEALENEYSKAKTEEDKLKQELARVSSRVIEVETELALATQNARDETASAGYPRKHELNPRGKSFTGTPSKKFYTITHTSEDEIADTSSSIAESPADESKQVEHENQLMKLENNYLQQQLAESEHVLAMYRQDLESAHDLIDKLQAEAKIFADNTKTVATEEDCKTPSDKDDTVQEIGDCSENANDEYKLLVEKHAELTREYEILRQQYQEAVTEKEKGADTAMTENEALKKEDLFFDDKTNREIAGKQQDFAHLQRTLEKRMKELEAVNSKFQITKEDLSQTLQTNNEMLKSLEDAKRIQMALEETINGLESEKKDSKSAQRSLEDQITRLKDENEKSRAEIFELTRGHPPKLQQTAKDPKLGKTGDNESKMRRLEEDLLKVTSEKLKLEFELRSANNDCERLKSDLHQSESERNLLNTQLNDNIERAANLEIRLMEMRCSCETIKDEINTLKNQKRQESFHLHEASVCKEILEKRLEDALKENNFLHHELETMREERKETLKKITKLEKEKDKLSKEKDEFRKQIHKEDAEKAKASSDGMSEKETEEASETMKLDSFEELEEYKKLHKEDQEQLMILREEFASITEDHKQIKAELEEIISVKENLEKQVENMKNTTMVNKDQLVSEFERQSTEEKETNVEEFEGVTFDTLEIEKQTKLLEKEKGLLEKELTRVQDECNKLKEKLEVINQASEKAHTQGEQRKELEEKQVQLEAELERLRELNQKLEHECEGSNKLIQELEIKTKALESLQKELHCFHEENDRLTQEVDIIQHTSKAMTDHQLNKESLETENSLLKQELQTVQDRNSKLQEQIEDMSEKLMRVKEEQEKISSTEKRNATSLQNEIDKFRTMHEHLESELATTQGKIKDLENANDSLKKENKALKGRINNEALRRKDDHKKAPSLENKSKTKLKHEQSGPKESKEDPTTEGEKDKRSETDWQQKVEQLENEKVQLENELNDLRKDVNDDCVAAQIGQGVSVATQTTDDPQPENKLLCELGNTTLTTNRDQGTNTESESEKESAPLAEDVKSGFSVMAKENLLLEKKASHFARAQMQLEQSLSKALRENATLKSKVSEAENVLGILRERVHELEKKTPTLMQVVDLKKSVMISDSESDSEEKELAVEDHKKESQNDDSVNKSTDQPNPKDEKTSKIDSEVCSLNPAQSDVDQLRSEIEKLTKELECLKCQKETLESDLTQKKDELESQIEIEENSNRQEQDNALLKQERNSLLEELEAATNQRNSVESDLRQNKESCLKQEQEMKLLLSSYSQEKESLLKELENTKSDCRKAKEKLRELQQVESDFEDIRKKSTEAEKLITELEKDLLCQTGMKNELIRELQSCQNQLQEIEHLQTQLRTCQTENDDLHVINNQLQEEIKKRKDDNNNLTDELKNAKIQLRSVEKQKKQAMNRNLKMKNLQDRSVQTESAIYPSVHVNAERVEDESTQTDVKVSNDTDMCEETSKTESEKTFPQPCEAGTGPYKTDKDRDGGSVEQEAPGTSHTNHEELEFTERNSFRRAPIPIIVVSHVDDIDTSNIERTTALNLCIEDFEIDSPNDQSTPDEEKEHSSSPTNKENAKAILNDVNAPPLQEEERSVGMSVCQQRQAMESEGKGSQEESVKKIDLESESEKTTLDGTNQTSVKTPDGQHLDEPEDVELEKRPLLQEELSCQIQRKDQPDNTQGDTQSISARRELEWTISSLKSELQQRAEENEKGQHEISLLVEKQLSMKREITSLLSECESLRAKVTILQTQNEAVLKEQILNDEENEELQQNLQDLLEERNSIEEAKKKLEGEKARLEIELSDAIETREAVEGELLRFRSENGNVSRHRMEGQLHDISERYAKLETVLSCVLDENSKMTAEVSALRAENSMLKSFKIMEITDNCTQFSPRTTEDESDGEGTQSAKRRKSDTKTIFPTAQRLRLGEGQTNQLPLTNSTQSTEPSQVQEDEEGATADEPPGAPTRDAKVKSEPLVATPTNEDGAVKASLEAKGVGTLSPQTNFEKKVADNSEKDAASEVKGLGKKQRRKTFKEKSSSHHKYDIPDDAAKVESDDNDSSMEVHTSSSLVSVTDLDISISSDQISSEDSSLVGPEIRVLQRMQKELAETKCSNVLVKNELSIIRKHNSELQNQMQKLLSRNNHLKTKMCDRALTVKRMEKEVSNIKDENNRLQEQALVLQDEMARVEKEKAKFERNMSSTKSENKRLKSDLSNIKAESYRTMKELVSLQSDNRRLQLEIERLRDECRSLKGNYSDQSVSQELSPWGSMSHGDKGTSRRSLQERPVKPEPAYLQQRAASDLTFGQHQRPTEHAQSPVSENISYGRAISQLISKDILERYTYLIYVKVFYQTESRN